MAGIVRFEKRKWKAEVEVEWAEVEEMSPRWMVLSSPGG